MICQKYKIAFIFSLFFVSLVGVSSCFAIEDVSYTYDSSNMNTINYLCHNNDSHFPNCSDYRYMIVSQNFVLDSLPSSPYQVPQFGIAFSGSTSYYEYVPVTPVGSRIFDLSYSYNFNFSTIFISAGAFSYASSLPSGWSFTILFTNDIGAGCDTPEGELDITENGQYDVTNYAQVNVDVPQTTQGQYHDDLMDIKSVLLIIPATLLVLYFFYCIYRIIISYGGSR